VPRHLVLVGLPGAGKTTVGRLVAARLNAPFADFDRVIEERTGKSVARIFAEDGEPAFRALESAVGAELLSGPPAVLAPGGGFLLDPGNRLRAMASGYVVYLQTSPAVAAARLGSGSGRPLLEGAELAPRMATLLDEREAFYLQAQEQVTTDEIAASGVAELVTKLARAKAAW